MTKKLLPRIKAIAPESAEVLEADSRSINIRWDMIVDINGERFNLGVGDTYLNYFDALVDIRSSLEELYAFLNTNLGTHYVVKNDTESNLRDLGYKIETLED